jgi:hypothetical protein
MSIVGGGRPAESACLKSLIAFAPPAAVPVTVSAGPAVAVEARPWIFDFAAGGNAAGLPTARMVVEGLRQTDASLLAGVANSGATR